MSSTIVAPKGTRPVWRWGEHDKEAFEDLGPHALYVAGPEQPMSGAVHCPDTGRVLEAFGGGHGLRLIAIGTNACPPWQDKISAVWHKLPWTRARMLIRLWVPSEVHAEQFASAARGYFRAAAACPDLMAGYIGLPAYVPLDESAGKAGVKQQLRQIAADMRLPWCLDDTDLWHACRRMADGEVDR